MFKRVNDFLSGVAMSSVGGLFLAVSLICSIKGIKLPIDPAWAAVFICGLPLVYLSIWRLIYNKGISKISSALLISVAMAASLMVNEIFAAGEVAFIMALGAILEDKITDRAKKGLQDLIELAPAEARKILENKETFIKSEEIKKGDVLRILPGETIPADGIIVKGNTSVNQAVMTGESLPIDKAVGDTVFCGTINCFGSIDIDVTKSWENSSLKTLVKMMKEADANKAPIARIADVWASWLVPFALLIALCAYVFTGELIRAVTVMVVFCPCALVLATPTAVMAAIGQAAKHGVIIKSGAALEIMGKADTVAFDKTGTLTQGKLEVSNIKVFSQEISEKRFVELAVSVESHSEHPLGKAVANYGKLNGVFPEDVNNFVMTAGLGVEGEINGEKIFCGSERFLLERGINFSSEMTEEANSLKKEGKALIAVALKGTCVGFLALSDAVKQGTAESVENLKNMGSEIVLLTGDNQKTAEYFAAKSGIENVYSELLPQDKVRKIKDLQESGKIVCMVGDGVNDAPALKTADVSAAMGKMGSDIAVDASDIAIMSDDIGKICYLKRLSAAAVNTIKFSIFLSLCINAAAVTLSVLGILNPTWGALVHNVGSTLVIFIAALLYDRNFL